MTQPRKNLSYGATEAKILIILQPKVSHFGWLHRCPTQASHQQGITHTNSTLHIVLIPDDAADANKESRSPLQTEAREEQRGGVEAAVPGRAGPCRSDESMEEC